MRILLPRPRASNVEGMLKGNIEDERNSVLMGNRDSEEGGMSNKAEVQLHLLECDGRLMQISKVHGLDS